MQEDVCTAPLEYYNEELTDVVKSCCGVRDSENDMAILHEPKKPTFSTNHTSLGSEKECKLSEFLRGSNSSWLTEENKKRA